MHLTRLLAPAMTGTLVAGFRLEPDSSTGDDAGRTPEFNGYCPGALPKPVEKNATSPASQPAYTMLGRFYPNLSARCARSLIVLGNGIQRMAGRCPAIAIREALPDDPGNSPVGTTDGQT